MKFCYPDWPDSWSTRFWRAIPHRFKEKPPQRATCARCNRINWRVAFGKKQRWS